MKLIILVACALVAVAVAAPPSEKEVKLLRAEFEANPDGSYVSGFETDDGTKRQEVGELKSVVDEENKPHNVVVVRGSYDFIDKEGNPQHIQYYADETGFHAEGDAVPKAPVV